MVDANLAFKRASVKAIEQQIGTRRERKKESKKF